MFLGLQDPDPDPLVRGMDDVVRKRKDMFKALKEEGLKREENKDVTEEEVDRLWNDER
jgi:hypothetical protein